MKKNKCIWLVLIASVFVILGFYLYRIERARFRGLLPEDGQKEDYTIEEVKYDEPKNIELIETVYDQFIEEIAKYHPVGHEENVYSFKDGVVDWAYLDAIIYPNDVEMIVNYSYSRFGEIEKRILLASTYTEDYKVNRDHLLVFSKVCHMKESELVRQVNDFMNQLENGNTEVKIAEMEEGVLRLVFLEDFRFNIIYDRKGAVE